MNRRQQNNKVAKQYAAAVAASNEKVPFAVVLIGSVVRGTDTSKSDLDLLLVGDEKLLVPKHRAPLQVQAFTKDRFLKRLHDGDDFIAWSIRFGHPLKGAPYWERIVGSIPQAVWPNWRRKLEHAYQRLVRASSLLKTGDMSAAAEETLSTADHTARAILLNQHVFPLSRSEMPGQLEQIKRGGLARTLERLTTDGKSQSSLSCLQDYLKRTLLDLDRHWYEETDKHHGEIQREKSPFELDSAAQSRISGHKRLLLRISSLVSDEAKRQAIHIGRIEVRPAWSNEYEEDSAVVVDVEVETDVDVRFDFWESLSKQLEFLATSLSSNEALFLQENISLIVSPASAV
jgi:predicted nucleotidyltransferase